MKKKYYVFLLISTILHGIILYAQIGNTQTTFLSFPDKSSSSNHILTVHLKHSKKNSSQLHKKSPAKSSAKRKANVYTHNIKKAIHKGSIDPKYPWRSRRLGEEGETIIEAIILKSGIVKSAKIVKTSGFARLDQAALNAVKKALFVPAMKNNLPIISKQSLTFLFVLKNNIN